MDTVVEGCKEPQLDAEDIALNSVFFKTLEAERTKIAREIHDSLGQDLTLLRLAMRNFYRANITSSILPAPVAAEFNELLEHVNRVIKSTRKLAYSLRTDIIEQCGFIDAAEMLVKDVKDLLNVNGKLELSPNWQEPPEQMSIDMYRCAQELLNNIAKHSRATRFIVRITCEKEKYVLSVLDDGVGIPPDAQSRNDRKPHVGLRSIYERTKLYNGTLSIRSRPEVKGTHIRAVFMR